MAFSDQTMSGLNSQIWRHCKEQHGQIISWRKSCYSIEHNVISVEAFLLSHKNSHQSVSLYSQLLMFKLLPFLSLKTGEDWSSLPTYQKVLTASAHYLFSGITRLYLYGRACITYKGVSWGFLLWGYRFRNKKLSKHKRDVQKVESS